MTTVYTIPTICDTQIYEDSILNNTDTNTFIYQNCTNNQTNDEIITKLITLEQFSNVPNFYGIIENGNKVCVYSNHSLSGYHDYQSYKYQITCDCNVGYDKTLGNITAKECIEYELCKQYYDATEKQKSTQTFQIPSVQTYKYSITPSTIQATTTQIPTNTLQQTEHSIQLQNIELSQLQITETPNMNNTETENVINNIITASISLFPIILCLFGILILIISIKHYIKRTKTTNTTQTQTQTQIENSSEEENRETTENTSQTNNNSLSGNFSHNFI